MSASVASRRQRTAAAPNAISTAITAPHAAIASSSDGRLDVQANVLCRGCPIVIVASAPAAAQIPPATTASVRRAPRRSRITVPAAVMRVGRHQVSHACPRGAARSTRHAAGFARRLRLRVGAGQAGGQKIARRRRVDRGRPERIASCASAWEPAARCVHPAEVLVQGLVRHRALTLPRSPDRLVPRQQGDNCLTPSRLRPATAAQLRCGECRGRHAATEPGARAGVARSRARRGAEVLTQSSFRRAHSLDQGALEVDTFVPTGPLPPKSVAGPPLQARG